MAKKSNKKSSSAYIKKLQEQENAKQKRMAELLAGTSSTAVITPGNDPSNVASYDDINGVHVENIACSVTDAANRTLTCTWSFNGTKHKYLDYFNVFWKYYTPSNGQWSDTSWSSVGTKYFSTYNVPANADRAKCIVKPVQKKKNKNQTITGKAKWTGSKARSPYGYVGEQRAIPTTPSISDFKITGNVLSCKVENYAFENAVVTFQILKDGSSLYSTQYATVTYSRASIEIPVDPGHKYCVRAMASRDGLSSEWSQYTSDLPTAPGTVEHLYECETQAVTETNTEYRVYLRWSKAMNVDDPTTDGYEIQFTTNIDYFDVSPDDVESVQVQDPTSIPLERVVSPPSAKQWFFRVRGYNTNGSGGWSEIKDASVGQPPDIPTTWSYMSNVKVGDDIIFNWTHNSIDGSKQTAAIINLTINGVPQDPIDTITTEKSYAYDTTGLPDGTVIVWTVKTKGNYPEYSKESVEREVRIHMPPSIGINVQLDEQTNNFTAFPLPIEVIAGPDSQNLLSMDLSIVSMGRYLGADDAGIWTIVSPGDIVYTRHIDNPTANTVSFRLTPGDINLADDTEYHITAAVYMSSGLQASSTFNFTTAFADDEFDPEASVEINLSNLTATIRPFCTDEFGIELRHGATLAVYRRNADGTYTEIKSGISMEDSQSVTDYHPTLDYARYRIVAKSNTTGRISFRDMEPEPVNVNSIVMQWMNEWFYDDDEGDVFSADMLILPYNVDVSETNSQDVDLVEYIGREHPVSYYGTQKGYSATWKCEIPKDDDITLFSIRRLARYAGDVYVREPSGTGYWANVKVQYTVNHNSSSISVTFNVTRVEGGA